ncbi:orotate phosphoribosyltransferase [Candidatus Woesearchaeota archaeon]|nr:orotate phosphoribosyltransferase [Candidatus Woesearchaeota archaeon]|tara:strand:+ start:7527 stop:8156 length:630 start_codon:yes stop_codon:yes gene_type:complete
MPIKEVAEMLLKSEAIILRPQEPFKFASGILSPIYCDNRLLLSKVEERTDIIGYYIMKIKDEEMEFDVVAGVATASIPWAALIAEKLGKPMIYIRKATKNHGRENLIEGKLEKGQKVLVVEDLVSTGGSSLNAIEAARNEGGVVDKCLAIFTYEMEKAKKSFEEAQCELVTLSDFTTLIEIAAKKGYIKEEEIKLLQEWNKNPEEWGKR